MFSVEFHGATTDAVHSRCMAHNVRSSNDDLAIAVEGNTGNTTAQCDAILSSQDNRLAFAWTLDKPHHNGFVAVTALEQQDDVSTDVIRVERETCARWYASSRPINSHDRPSVCR